MRLVLPALLFAAHYVMMMALCGAIVWRMLAYRKPGGPTQTTIPEPREGVATFLIGTGFAPFVIGLLQGLFWIVLPHLHVRAYAVIQWTIVIAGIVICRKIIGRIAREAGLVIGRDGSTRTGTFIVIAAVGFVTIFAAGHALQPQRQYDATTYALDARRLASERDWSALMPLTPTETDHQFANHNHGASYQAYLSASMLYRSKTNQDLPLRVAQQALAVHGVIMTVALGLRIGGLVGVLAPLILLLYPWWGHMMGSASRDFFRIIPFLLAIGIFRTRGEAPGFNLQGVLLCFAFAFLWNSHASSLMIAFLLLAGMCVVAVRPISILVLLIAFVIGTALGASHLIRAAIDTGDPLTYSPIYNVNYEGTAVVEPWLAARQRPEPGLANAWDKLGMQLDSDGGPVRIDGSSLFRTVRSFAYCYGVNIVLWMWISLIAFLGWVAARVFVGRKIPWPPALAWLIAGILIVSELLLAGAADWLKSDISPTFSMNPRYRAHLYPIASVLIALMVQQAFKPNPQRDRGCWFNLAGIVACGFAMFVAFDRWSKPSYPPQPNTEKANAYLADQVPYYEWARYFRHIDAGELIVMDYAYLGWYQTESKIMFTQDPRLREAFTASDPDRVIQFFDELGVRYLYLIELERSAILASEIALADAIRSDALELIVEYPGVWYLYRRADEPPARLPETPGGSPGAVQRGAWTLVRDLMQDLQSPAFRERERAAEAIIRLGPAAADALHWFADSSDDESLRRSCLNIIGVIESPALSALDALDSIARWDDRRFVRATEPQRRLSGPQLADHLRMVALLRGVSIASSSREFVALILARSTAADDGYFVILDDGGQRAVADWLAEPISPGHDDVAELQ